MQDPDRRLPVLLGRGPTMTRRKCALLAKRDGYRYAGLQYGTECWAGEDGCCFLLQARSTLPHHGMAYPTRVLVSSPLRKSTHADPCLHPWNTSQETTWPGPPPGVWWATVTRPVQATGRRGAEATTQTTSSRWGTRTRESVHTSVGM